MSIQGTVRHVGMLLRSVGCHKLPAEVWGEEGFLFFWHNETHSRTQKRELLESRGWMNQGQNIRDEGANYSGSQAPQSRRLCRYGNYSLYSAGLLI